MDENVYLVLDYDKICRLCLNAKGAMSEIFANTETELLQQIKLVTGVNVSQGNGLPNKICHKCRYVVEISYELREIVLKADQLLNEASMTCGPDDISKNDNIDVKKELFEDISSAELCSRNENERPNNCDSIEQTNISSSEDFSNKSEINKGDNRDTHVTQHSTVRKKPKTYIRTTAPKHLTCQICLKPFQTLDKVHQHIETHYKGTSLTSYMELRVPYYCEECRGQVPTKKQLILHHRRHLNVNPFVCQHPGCTFVGKDRVSLRHHGQCHSARTHVCEKCGASFKRQFELQQHCIRHEDEGATYPCRSCRVVCRNRLSYRAHLKFHELGRRFKCDRLGCTKSFYSRVDLQAHQRSHDNDRRYRCHLCVSSYLSQSQLNRHLRMHGKRRVNKCDKCCASFDNYSAFYNHRVEAHGPWLPHKCNGCNQRYQTEQQLEKHESRCQFALNLQQLLSTDTQYASTLKPSEHQDSQETENTTISSLVDLLEMRRPRSRPLVVQPAQDVSGLPNRSLLYVEVDPDAEKEPSSTEPWDPMQQ